MGGLGVPVRAGFAATLFLDHLRTLLLEMTVETLMVTARDANGKMRRM